MAASHKRKQGRSKRESEKYAKKIKASSEGNNWVQDAPQGETAEFAFDSDPIEDSPTPELSGEEDGVSWPSDDEGGVRPSADLQTDTDKITPTIKDPSSKKRDRETRQLNKSAQDKTSRIKQKELAQERKASKANADLILRAKKIWERLRMGAVPSSERKDLIEELFNILTGRVKEFVLKHDAGRVVQSALKHGNTAQRRMIASELKGEYRQLAASKYAKYTIGKLLSNGDDIIRDIVVPEFYGHVRSLIRHPEGGWILDDVYRGAATKKQKARLLREWYGAEFSIMDGDTNFSDKMDLSDLLKSRPEKRGPVMKYLFEMVNQLIQKGTTGFTMLHDAMLQYYINVPPQSEDSVNFVETILGDEEGDLLKNLAFTISGARLVCLILAHSNAKERKLLLRTYKGHIPTLAFDSNGHKVLLAALEVIDDTVLTSKLIYGELISKSGQESDDQLLQQILDSAARIPLLLPYAHRTSTILNNYDKPLLEEVYSIRASSSKKDPTLRFQELMRHTAPSLLSLLSRRIRELLQTSYGCIFIQEVLVSSPADFSERDAARDALVDFLSPNKKLSHPEEVKDREELLNAPAVTRLLKTLVYSGHFNNALGRVELCSPALGFASSLYSEVFSNGKNEKELLKWAVGFRTFVVEAMLKTEDLSLQQKKDIRSILVRHVALLRDAAAGDSKTVTDVNSSQNVAGAKQASSNGKAGMKNIKDDSLEAAFRVGSKGAKALLELISQQE